METPTIDFTMGVVPAKVKRRPAPAVDFSLGVVPATKEEPKDTPQAAPKEDFLSNPKGEGVYKMDVGEVPFSRVEDALDKGHKFKEDNEFSRYHKDFAFSQKHPKHEVEGEGTYEMVGPEGNPVQVGYSKVVDALKSGKLKFSNEHEANTFSDDWTADKSSDKPDYTSLPDKFDMVAYPKDSPKWEQWMREHAPITLGMVRQATQDVVHASDILEAGEKKLGIPGAGEEDEFSKEIRKFAAEPTSGLQSVGATITDVGEFAGGEEALALAGKAPLAIAEKLGLEYQKLGKLDKLAELLKKYPKLESLVKGTAGMAGRAAKTGAVSGAQAYLQSGGDTEEAKRGAIAGAAVSPVIDVAAAGIGKITPSILRAARAFAGTAESDTRDIVRELEEKNRVLREQHTVEAQKVIDDNNKEIEAAKNREKSAREDYEKKKAKYDKELEEHNQRVAKYKEENASEEERAATENKANRDKAEKDYNDALEASKSNDANRSKLARQEAVLRFRLADRVKAIKKAAKSFVDNQWDEIRKAVGSAEVPMAPLSDAVKNAQNKWITGSTERIREFEDIVKKAQADGEVASLRDQVSKGNVGGGVAYDELSPIKREAVDKVVNDLVSKGEVDEGEEKGINFANLRGYYTELNQKINNLNWDGKGDIYKALIDVRDHIGSMIDDMANEAGVGSKLKTAKKDYRVYKQVFDTPTGPSGSGSAVAKSLDARDAYNATEPLVKTGEPIVAADIRQMLVGKEFGGPYYDPNAGKLLDQLRDIRGKLDKWKPQEVGEFKAPKEVKPKTKQVPGEFKKTEPKEFDASKYVPKTKPVPEFKPETISPEELSQQKRQALYAKFREYRALSKYQARLLAGGMSSLLAGAVALNQTRHGSTAAEVAAGAGILGYAIGPRFIAKLMDDPRLIRQLTKVTKEDLSELSNLPPEYRHGVEERIIELAQEAQKAGKLKVPSPWIKFIAAIEASRQANKSSEEQRKREVQQ